METKLIPKETKNSLIEKLKSKLFNAIRLNNHPVIKVYRGFGNNGKITVMGHVLRVSPKPRVTYRQNLVINLFSILRLFMVVPFSGAKISIVWEGITYYTTAEKDGFFRFEISPEKAPDKGWQSVLVKLEEKEYQTQNITGAGEICVPFVFQHGFISDIDDTFLISHSTFLRKRLSVLLFKNARSRKAFEGVVNHYQLLSTNGQVGDNTNPFFYVSGSEWNLYNLLLEFTRVNYLPKGIFLLSPLKKIFQFWKSGQNGLMTKFSRIVRVIEAFPHLKFVLLGDDSQKDVEIYSSIAIHFPEKIFAVYIRNVGKMKSEGTMTKLKEMERLGISCCYFKHSSEAVIHSKKIGLIKQGINQ